MLLKSVTIRKLNRRRLTKGISADLFLSGFQDTVELSGTVHLVSHCRATILAPIFVFIAFRQYEEQRLSDRRSATAFGAIELGGLKLIKLILWLVWGLIAGPYEIKGSFLHGQNLWISTMDCAKRGVKTPSYLATAIAIF